MNIVFNDGHNLELPEDDKFVRARKNKLSHARNRLMERFGIRLTDEMILDISSGCESYELKPVLLKEGKSFHFTSIGEQELYVVYDWEYHTIVTFYYKHWLTEINGTFSITILPIRAKWRRKKQRFQDKDKTVYGKTFF